GAIALPNWSTAIALALSAGAAPAVVVVAGLIIFGAVFALNSAVHSYLILAYTDSDKVAMSVGFYYMANAAGRLAGTVLSGALYQWGLQSGAQNGLVACLWASSAFVLVAGLLSLLLPRQAGTRSKPIRLGDLGE
ncbi:MAG TPA: MFS transporter, partial [Accumulibacter sp.]|nr:MFS transporter [Accumulibacter sp.]